MSQKTIFIREWLTKFIIMVISEGEAGGRIREEICIILAAVLFLKLNGGSYI